jgi:hypothetical protein
LSEPIERSLTGIPKRFTYQSQESISRGPVPHPQLWGKRLSLEESGNSIKGSFEIRLRFKTITPTRARPLDCGELLLNLCHKGEELRMEFDKIIDLAVSGLLFRFSREEHRFALSELLLLQSANRAAPGPRRAEQIWNSGWSRRILETSVLELLVTSRKRLVRSFVIRRNFIEIESEDGLGVLSTLDIEIGAGHLEGGIEVCIFRSSCFCLGAERISADTKGGEVG